MIDAADEVFERLDVLAGRRLVYVSKVERVRKGGWSVERVELAWPEPRPLKDLLMEEQATDRLPRVERVYLFSPGMSLDGLSGFHPSRSLYPLAVFDTEENDLMFINGCQGSRNIEYLSYLRGVSEREVVMADHRDLMQRVLHAEMREEDLQGWAETCLAEETASRPKPGEPSRRRIGEFEILSTIRSGGMGTVYRAWQPSLCREVALKVLNQPEDEECIRLFRREIRAMGRIDHPHLVKAFACGTQGRTPYIVMELIDGTDLNEVIEEFQTSDAAKVDEGQWDRAVVAACQHARENTESATSGEMVSSGSRNNPTNEPSMSAFSAPPSTRVFLGSHVGCVVELVPRRPRHSTRYTPKVSSIEM